MTPPQDPKEILRLMGGVKRFAWLPTKIHKKWVFLGDYYEFYEGVYDPNGKSFLWSAGRDTFNPIIHRLLPDEALIRKLKGQHGKIHT